MQQQQPQQQQSPQASAALHQADAAAAAISSSSSSSSNGNLQLDQNVGATCGNLCKDMETKMWDSYHHMNSSNFGSTNDWVLLQPPTNFKLYKQLEQPFPPVLADCIWCCWPDLAKWSEDAELVLPIEDQEPDVAAPDEQIPDFEELVQPHLQIQLVQPDWLHIVALGVAAMGMQMEDPVEDPEAAVEVPHPDQEICSLYEADWDLPPPLIPVVDLPVVWRSQHSQVEGALSESSGDSVGTYEDSELMGTNSDWCVLGR
jgi:hypothetical protein